MDPDQGYWIQFWEDTLFWKDRQTCLFQCQSGVLLGKADLIIFGAKMAPCCGGRIYVLRTQLLDLVV